MKRVWALFCIASAAWLLPLHRRGLAMVSHNILANALVTMGVLWLPSRWHGAKAVTAAVLSVLRLGWSAWQGALQAMPPAPFQPFFEDRTAYLLLVWACLLTQTVNRTLLPAWFVNLQVTGHALVFSVMGYKFDHIAAAPQPLSFLHQAALLLGPQMLVHIPILLLSKLWAWYDPTWNRPIWQAVHGVQHRLPEQSLQQSPAADTGVLCEEPAGMHAEAAAKRSSDSTDKLHATSTAASNPSVTTLVASRKLTFTAIIQAVSTNCWACLGGIRSMFSAAGTGAGVHRQHRNRLAGTRVLTRMCEHSYSRYVSKTHKVCLKLDTHLECSDLPTNLVEQLQGALNSTVNPPLVITACATRSGCIMITLDLRECGQVPGSRASGGARTGGGFTDDGGGDVDDCCGPAGAGVAANMSQHVAAALLPTLQRILNEAAAAKVQHAHPHAAGAMTGTAPAAPAAAPAAAAGSVPDSAANVLSPASCIEAVVQVDQQLCDASFCHTHDSWQVVPQQPMPTDGVTPGSSSSSAESALSQPWLGIATVAGATFTADQVHPQCAPKAAHLRATHTARNWDVDSSSCHEGQQRSHDLPAADSKRRQVRVGSGSLLVHVVVQLWDFGKLDELQGWSAEMSAATDASDSVRDTADTGAQPPSAANQQDALKQGSGSRGRSSSTFKLLARCSGRYLSTRIQHCRRDTASTSTMAHAALVVPDACLARHHVGGAPSCMLLVTLELWQGEVLLSSSPLLAVPNRATASLQAAGVSNDATPIGRTRASTARAPAPVHPHGAKSLRGGKVVVGPSQLSTSSSMLHCCVRAITGSSMQVAASDVAGVLPTAWWWGTSGKTLTAAVAQLEACSHMLCTEAANVPVDSLQSHLQFLRDLALWVLEVRRASAAGFCDACGALPELQVVDGSATVSAASQLQLDVTAQLQLAEDLMQYAEQVGLQAVRRMVSEQLQSVVSPMHHKHSTSTMLKLRSRVHAHAPASLLLYMRAAHASMFGYRCALCELQYVQMLVEQLARVQIFSSAGTALYGAMAIRRAAQLGGYWHLLVCVPWSLLHASAVLTRCIYPTASPQLAIGLSGCGYLWRVVVRLVFGLGLLPQPPYSAYFCRTFKGWPLTHLTFALTEQMQASAVLPARVMLFVVVGIDMASTALCLWQHSQQRVLAFVILPLVALLPRLVLGTMLRCKAMSTWRNARA